jgi:DNA repair protein RecO (recombination protein O)
MASTGDSAVVLARRDYSETSQVIVLFTRQHGKVRAIAKGIKRGTKKRFAVGIDLLDIGQVVFSVRQERTASLATLTEWKQTQSLSGLREKLFRIHGAQYFAEITERLSEDWDPHVELFDALISTLATLAEAAEALTPVVDYQLRLLASIGSQPRFDVCVLCRRESDLTYFSSLEGGMICRHCEPVQVEKWQVSNATLKYLRGRVKDRITSGSPTGAFSVLNYHIAHLMGREPMLAAKLVPRAGRRLVE